MKLQNVLVPIVILAGGIVSYVKDVGGFKHQVAMTLGLYGKKIEAPNGSTTYFTKKVTQTEAEKLVSYMKKEGFYADGNPKDLQLTKDEKNPDVYEIRLVTIYKNADELHNNKKYKETFIEFDKLISKNVFDGKPVETELCNNKFEPLEMVKSNE